MSHAFDHLKHQVARLAPWHYDIEIKGVRTSEFEAAHKDGFANIDNFALGLPHYGPRRQVTSILDVGANCGYLSWLALKRYGMETHVDLVEPRSTWASQAVFLAEHLFDEMVTFALIPVSIDSFLGRSAERYDFVIFSGLLYHLRNPLEVLFRLAMRTSGTMFISTTVDVPVGDGNWKLYREPTTDLHGMDGVAFWPGGVGSIEPILQLGGLDVVRHYTHHCPDEGKEILSIWAERKR